MVKPFHADLEMKVKYCICTLILVLPIYTFANNEIINNDIKKKCHYPERPHIPNTLSITEKELNAIQKRVKTFIKKGENYLECIALVEKSWGDEVTHEQKQLIILIHNNIVENMKSVADKFNSAVREYEGKRKKY